MPEEISFGRWLRQRRRTLDLAQKALAEQVGCAEITVRRMEADAYKPSNELAFVLFEKLGVSESERPQWVAFARGMSGLPTKQIVKLNKPKSNLPASLTSFIGREKEQAEVITLIDKHRLVTLTGSGGVGKTRFAISAGGQLLENYPDGVWWIELASLNNSLLLPQTIAASFGLKSQSGITHINLLVNFLRAKSILLILDNCEHLLDGCAHLTDTLLKNCPDLKILVTSREPLGAMGEARYRIPSLGMPDPQGQLDSLKNIESIRLFEERAQLIQFDFSLTPDNAESIAQICRRLNGIPLAIELAAAKVGMLSPAQIAGQLEESLNLLTGGFRTALPRHQTLRASLDWSWNLLSKNEQKLMRQLSVFTGGWTLEAAQSICDGNVSDLLHSLVTKSLITAKRATHDNIRYAFHETIRQYAQEKLEEGEEGKVVRGRHLDFFLAIALRFEQEVHGSQISDWTQIVRAELDNLHKAMKWAGESGRVQSGLRLGFALHYYWLNQGYWGLGRELLEWLLAHPEAARHPIARANALNLAGDLATQQGDLKAAQFLLEESIAIALEIGEAGKASLGWARMLLGQSLMNNDKTRARHELDQSVILLREAGESWRFAIALLVRGHLAISEGDMTDAHNFFSESLAVLQNIGDTWTAALPTMSLGQIFYYRGEYASATTNFQQALELSRAIGDKIYSPEALGYLGSIAVFQKDNEKAVIYFGECLSMTRELMDKAGIASALSRLGIALGHQGNYDDAVKFLCEGLELSQVMDNRYLIAACLTGLADIAQQPRHAAQLLAASQAAFERSGRFVDPLYRAAHQRTEESVRTTLGEEAFAAAYTEGKKMSLEDAIKFALEDTEASLG